VAYWERIRQAAESGDPNAYAAARASVRAQLAGVGVPLDVDQQDESTLSIPTSGVSLRGASTPRTWTGSRPCLKWDRSASIGRLAAA